MEFKPHNYQQYAINYIKEHEIAAVLLDMGLGKTVITLTALLELLFDSFDAHKVLVIAPLRVARDTWPAEIAKWDHLGMLKYSVAVGSKDERIKALNAKADIYIINRENVPWLINESGFTFEYDTVVIDELSSFKSHKAQRFRALSMVRPNVKRIIGLTGTPAPNSLMDLFAEYKLLDMGKRLGKFITHFRDAYFWPDKRSRNVIFTYKPKVDAEERIYKAISDITISMSALDHIKMPEKVLNNVEVEMTDKEAKAYSEFKDELVVKLGEKELDASNAAVLAGKLSQMANGAVYDEDKNIIELHEHKLDALEDLIEAANGKPVLIAYWYKHDLERIKNRLNKDKIEFTVLDSHESFEKWNKGEISVALLHPASAGHGLNLQDGGSTLIWFGLTWSLELYQQTNARLYRQGQKNTVVINHIITKDTIDEQIVKALQNKERTQNDLIAAVKASL